MGLGEWPTRSGERGSSMGVAGSTCPLCSTEYSTPYEGCGADVVAVSHSRNRGHVTKGVVSPLKADHPRPE